MHCQCLTERSKAKKQNTTKAFRWNQFLSRTGLCSCNRDLRKVLRMVFCVFKCNFELLPFENLQTARNREILNGTLNCFVFQRRQKVMLEFLNSFTMLKAMNISQFITAVSSETILYNLKAQLVVSWRWCKTGLCRVCLSFFLLPHKGVRQLPPVNLG